MQKPTFSNPQDCEVQSSKRTLISVVETLTSNSAFSSILMFARACIFVCVFLTSLAFKSAKHGELDQIIFI